MIKYTLGAVLILVLGLSHASAAYSLSAPKLEPPQTAIVSTQYNDCYPIANDPNQAVDQAKIITVAKELAKDQGNQLYLSEYYTDIATYDTCTLKNY
jgi:hypothetical protein